MQAAATRWRLIELQRRRRAIDAGIELLDRKREALVRALARHRLAAAERRRRVGEAINRARARLDAAVVLIGDIPAAAAATAQPPSGTIDLQPDAIMGVHVARYVSRFEPFHACYGPGGTCGQLDGAGEAFVALMPDIIALAQEEQAARSLRRGLRRTTRTLNALRAILRPAVAAEIRLVAGSLEEEEREEAIRWRTRR